MPHPTGRVVHKTVAAAFKRLMQVARKLDKADKVALVKCAEHLKRLQQYAYCAEVYNKLGDKKSTVKLHVDTENWEEVSGGCVWLLFDYCVSVCVVDCLVVCAVVYVVLCLFNCVISCLLFCLSDRLFVCVCLSKCLLACFIVCLCD